MELDLQKAGGLVPAIIQDLRTGDVLMLGFMNLEAFTETMRTREVVFFSRSRNKLWKKGETSGHVLKVLEVCVDCDADALLEVVWQSRFKRPITYNPRAKEYLIVFSSNDVRVGFAYDVREKNRTLLSRSG